MAEFTDYMEKNIIDHFLRDSTSTPSTTIYVALFTTSAGLEANLPTGEVTPGAGEYTRQSVTLAEGTGGTSWNTAILTWATATANWGTVSHAALVDHVSAVNWGTGVNALMWSPLDANKTVDSGDQFKISAGDLDVTVA